MCLHIMIVLSGIAGAQTRADAGQLDRDASRFFSEGNYARALELYQHSLELKLKDFGPENQEVATAYNNIGSVYYSLRDYPRALEQHQKSLRIRLKLFGEEHVAVAHSYSNIALVYSAIGDHPRAVEFYQKCLPIRRNVLGPEHALTITIHDRLGSEYYELTNFPRALEHFRISLDLKSKTLGPRHASVADAQIMLGHVLKALGRYQNALEMYQLALVLRQGILGPEHPRVAICHNNVGLALEALGDHPRALEQYQKSLSIMTKANGPNHPAAATSLNNIGNAYIGMGDYQRALEQFRRALAIWVQAHGTEHPESAVALDNIGNTLIRLGDLKQAEEYIRKGLAVRKNALGSADPAIADSHRNLARLLDEKKDYAGALSEYLRSLEISLRTYGTKHPQTANDYNSIGTIQHKLGDLNHALESHRRALEIWNTTLGAEHVSITGAYNNIGIDLYALGNGAEALAYGKKAFTAFRASNAFQEWADRAADWGREFLHRDDLDHALSFFDDGIAAVEKARRYIGTGRTNFMEKHIGLYYYAIKAVLRRGDSAAAFAYSEAMRSRGFLDRLALSSALTVAGVQPQERQNILALAAQLEDLGGEIRLESQLPATAQTPGKLADLSVRRDDAERRFEDLDKAIAKRLPRYAALRNPLMIGLEDAKKTCAPDQAILEYVIWEDTNPGSAGFADKQSWCLVITREGIQAVPLPADFNYSGKVGELRAALSADPANGGMKAIEKASAELYQSLVAPVEQYLSRKRRLLIIPDGPLAFLPFDVLRPEERQPYLGRRFLITFSPSISVSAAIHQSGKASVEVLAFGGGIYSKQGRTQMRGSQRGVFVEQATLQPPGGNIEYLAAKAAKNGAAEYFQALGLVWNDLPGTAREIKRLAAEVFSTQPFIDFTGEKASEATLKSLSAKGELLRYAILHFACHGYYDRRLPGMSSLVFSEVSEKLPQSKEDGYLTVEEAALLQLNAALVQLSACETGLGEIRKGDGLLGLTRAFMIAGSRNVGVTLWTVADDATAEFMVRLYKKVIRNGASFTEAFHEVKVEFQENQDLSHPFFWAPFVLYE